MLADWENHKIRNWIALILGVFLIAISVNWVYDPAGMVTGGRDRAWNFHQVPVRQISSGGNTGMADKSCV